MYAVPPLPPPPTEVCSHTLPVGWDTKDDSNSTLCHLDPLCASMHSVAILLWNNNTGLQKDQHHLYITPQVRMHALYVKCTQQSTEHYWMHCYMMLSSTDCHIQIQPTTYNVTCLSYVPHFQRMHVFIYTC